MYKCLDCNVGFEDLMYSDNLAFCPNCMSKNFTFITEKKITFSIPYEDKIVAPYTMCPKEVMLKAHTDKIGGIIDFCGEPKKVVSVTVDEKWINITLEDINKR